jgi:hypothetical protein
MVGEVEETEGVSEESAAEGRTGKGRPQVKYSKIEYAKFLWLLRIYEFAFLPFILPSPTTIHLSP